MKLPIDLAVAYGMLQREMDLMKLNRIAHLVKTTGCTEAEAEQTIRKELIAYWKPAIAPFEVLLEPKTHHETEEHNG